MHTASSAESEPGPVLITGAAGFVGRHLIAHLLASGDGPIVALDRTGLPDPPLPPGVSVHRADLTDRVEVERLIRAVRPAQVYHLAAQASVAASRRDPLGTIVNNVAGQVHLLEALVELGTNPRVLVVGSSEEYGQVTAGEVPVRETSELRPLSAYAVSKVAQDLLGYQYAQTYGLPVVRVRAFTHVGPGQEPRFVTPSFARQIARIEVGLQPPTLAVGNLDARRDISDVRDVVRAYRLALLRGEPGAVYNVGRGEAVAIQTILDRLVGLSGVSIAVEVDPERVRPAEPVPQIADCSRLRERTGWEPRIPLETSLRDVLADWRARVARREAEA